MHTAALGEPFVVTLPTIGTVGPDIRRGIVGVAHMPQLAAIGLRRRCHFDLADKAETPIDW